MPTWTAFQDGKIEPNLYDVELLDSANTFGDEAILKFDDVDGTLFDKFNRGTRVDVTVNPGTGAFIIELDETVITTFETTDEYSDIYNQGTYENAGTVKTEADNAQDKFSGYVVERREIEQGGADALEVTAYTFDQFLRRNKVSNDLSGQTIASALESIIKNDTPVTFNASNIEVGDEQELTRSYRGDPVEQTLQDLAFKSNDENFGVNDDLEFFFRPRETKHIDRGIDDTQWFNTDIPERGKEAINEVEVWYNDGDESVIVDDGGDKLDLQNSLGLDDPGKQKAEITREELTNISDAEDEGRKYLNFRNNTLSGQITTFGLFNAQPGDTIDVTISTQGINTEFQIAEVEYRWGTDETILTVVEKRGDNDDVLLRLTEAVSRVEMRPSDRDAPKNRITTTNAQAIIETSAADSVEGAIDRDRFTNLGRNLIRDAWIGEGIDPIDTLVVGDDADGLSRSNESLRNQTNSIAVSPSLAGSDGVEFTATVNQSISELGLETTSGELVYRAVIDDGLSASDITVTLTATDDDSISRGVITNDGQTAVRDILADNSPTLPDEYAYGSDDTSVSESDTSLGNQLVKVKLNEVTALSADSDSEWSNNTTISSTDPLIINNSELRQAQVGYFVEAENADSVFSSIVTESEYSNGDAVECLDGAAQGLEHTFTIEKPISASNATFQFRKDAEGGTNPPFEILLDNNVIEDIPQDAFLDGVDWFGVNIGFDLSAGSHTVEFEFSGEGDGNSIDIDCLFLYDDRFNYNFDNTVDSNGYLSGPQLYADQNIVSLSQATTQRKFDEARFTSSWNDTSNNQYVELSNDGGSNFVRINNSDSGTATFSNFSETLDTNLSFSAFGSRTTASPTSKFNGQAVDSLDLIPLVRGTVTDGIGDALARAIVDPGTITNQTVREAGLFSGSTLLTRHRLAEFTVDSSSTRIASAETTRFTGDE